MPHPRALACVPAFALQSAEFEAFLTPLLALDALERPSAAAALAHPWLLSGGQGAASEEYQSEAAEQELERLLDVSTPAAGPPGAPPPRSSS